jgi:hypothetical protein
MGGGRNGESLRHTTGYMLCKVWIPRNFHIKQVVLSIRSTIRFVFWPLYDIIEGSNILSDSMERMGGKPF